MQAIHITGIQANGMASFSCRIPVLKEIVGHLWRTSHLAGSLQTKDEEIKDKAIVLENKCRELQSTDQTEGVGMRHIFVCQG